MEYPTLFTVGTRWLMPREDTYLEDTVVHEAGHQWWYGMVATNEFEDAWMDEGINQYANARVMAEEFPDGREVRRFFGGFVPWVLDDVRWDRLISGESSPLTAAAPPSTSSQRRHFKYWPRTSTPMTYAKPALVASHARARAGLDHRAADPLRRSSIAGSSSTRRPATCFRWRTR